MFDKKGGALGDLKKTQRTSLVSDAFLRVLGEVANRKAKILIELINSYNFSSNQSNIFQELSEFAYN